MLDALTPFGGLSRVDTVPKWQTRGRNVSVLAGGPYCQRTDTGEGVDASCHVLSYCPGPGVELGANEGVYVRVMKL